MISIPFWKRTHGQTRVQAPPQLSCGGPSILFANVPNSQYMRLLVLEETQAITPQLRLLCNGCVDNALLNRLPYGEPHLLSELAFQQLTVELPMVGQILSERQFRQRLFNVLEFGPLVVRMPPSGLVQLYCYYGVWLNQQELLTMLDLGPAKPGWRLRVLDIPIAHMVLAPSATELLECLPNFMLTHDLVAISSMIGHHLDAGGK